MKTTEITSEEELESAFLEDPEFGLALLHDEFKNPITRYIKSRLWGVRPPNTRAEAIRDVYCNTMVSLTELSRKAGYDWHQPLGIVFRIAFTEAANYVRARNRSHKQDLDGALDRIVSDLSGTQIDQSWRIVRDEDRSRFNAVLQTAINTKLTDKEVTVATCFVDNFEDFGANDIYGPLARKVSEMTGKDENAMTVKKQWMKAKEKLKRELIRSDFKFLDIEE